VTGHYRSAHAAAPQAGFTAISRSDAPSAGAAADGGRRTRGSSRS
jgi:hypothetical protein